MKHQTTTVIIASLITTLITGCAKEPPKCSDEATLSLVRQIIAEQLIGRSVPDKGLKDILKIELPRASGFDEKIKEFTCEAKLIAGGTVQMPITYKSQLDDKDQHIVVVGGISRGDLIALLYAVANSTEIPQSASSTVSSIAGTWKGSLEGDGYMTVAASATGVEVALNVSSPSGCAGTFKGAGSLANNVLTLTKKDADQVCTITIKFSGDTAEVDENNCSSHHGAACGFSGTLNRQK